jgi:LmbE family N-acetylglucosaminyl deacetylase
MSDTSTFKPKVVLGVAAHPDDLDFAAGGSIASWTKQGAKVYYFILTNGNKGTDDRTIAPDKLRDLRREEQRQAAKILGVTDVFFADYQDGLLEPTEQVKTDIVRMIRRIKPDTVITYDPTTYYDAARGLINHTDHRACGQATMDAVYPLARDHLSYPTLLADEGLEPHNVASLLLFAWENTNFAVDIGTQLETKLQALRAHTSQFDDLALEAAKTLAKENDTLSGAMYAERFVRIDIRTF